MATEQAIPGTVVNPSSLFTPGGEQGVPGTTGVNAYTTVTAGFTVPAIGSTVSITVQDASWIAVGQMLYVATAGSAGAAGAFQVQSKSGNTLTLLNVQSSTPVPGPQGAPGAPGVTGPAGPTAVSADAGNQAKLGSDNLIYIPNTIPIAFVFPFTPKAGAMINVPITINLNVAANLVGSAYYNATDPSTTAAVFTLTVQPAGTVIGTINKPTGSGTATFSGTGSSTLTPGNALRMSATTVDSVIADIGITILARR